MHQTACSHFSIVCDESCYYGCLGLNGIMSKYLTVIRWHAEVRQPHYNLYVGRFCSTTHLGEKNMPYQQRG